MTVDLGGWLVDDAEGESDPYSIPVGTALEPGAFLVLYGQRTGLVLEDGGDEVRLLKPDGTLADVVVFGTLGGNVSYNRDKARWYASQLPSPGAPNVPMPPGLRW
jgi:hypothetical protein